MDGWVRRRRRRRVRGRRRGLRRIWRRRRNGWVGGWAREGHMHLPTYLVGDALLLHGPHVRIVDLLPDQDLGE